MNRVVRIAHLLALTFIVAAAPAALADDLKEAEEAMGMQPPKPGPQHAYLMKAVGTWKAVTKMTMDPSQPPAVGEGKEEVRSICDGLWIEVSYKGSDGFEGHGVEGFDTTKNKYVGTWVDSWGTALATYEGTADASGKKTSYTMMTVNPATGAPQPMFMEHEYVNDTTRVSRMWQGAEPKGPPTFEITYTKM